MMIYTGVFILKYLKQFSIILIITFIGEFLKMLLPFSMPAGIYGMAVLFICLMTGVIKLEHVNDCGKFLIEIMPVMFIPAGVGLMSSYDVLKPMLFPVSVITVVSLVAVMAVSGLVSQGIIAMKNKFSNDKSREIK